MNAWALRICSYSYAPVLSNYVLPMHHQIFIFLKPFWMPIQNVCSQLLPVKPPPLPQGKKLFFFLST